MNNDQQDQQEQQQPMPNRVTEPDIMATIFGPAEPQRPRWYRGDHRRTRR
jgi:hypothetical protein